MRLLTLAVMIATLLHSVFAPIPPSPPSSPKYPIQQRERAKLKLYYIENPS
jgi:hypothetical protein